MSLVFFIIPVSSSRFPWFLVFLLWSPLYWLPFFVIVSSWSDFAIFQILLFIRFRVIVSLFVTIFGRHLFTAIHFSLLCFAATVSLPFIHRCSLVSMSFFWFFRNHFSSFSSLISNHVEVTDFLLSPLYIGVYFFIFNVFALLSLPSLSTTSLLSNLQFISLQWTVSVCVKLFGILFLCSIFLLYEDLYSKFCISRSFSLRF